jgi:hypothetical protein
MALIKFVFRILDWVVTILLEIVFSYLVIFLFSVIFAGVDTTSRSGWLLLLFFIWLGYVIGVFLVGYGSLRWVRKEPRLLPKQRLLATIVGALIPLLILLPIGFSVPVGDQGSRFYYLVTSNWQPILAQASLFTAIVGFYLPGVLKVKTS